METFTVCPLVDVKLVCLNGLPTEKEIKCTSAGFPDCGVVASVLPPELISAVVRPSSISSTILMNEFFPKGLQPVIKKLIAKNMKAF